VNSKRESKNSVTNLPSRQIKAKSAYVLYTPRAALTHPLHRAGVTNYSFLSTKIPKISNILQRTRRGNNSPKTSEITGALTWCRRKIIAVARTRLITAITCPSTLIITKQNKHEQSKQVDKAMNSCCFKILKYRDLGTH
jgi:hypothetical protein